MFHEKDITIPANTDKTSPVVVTWRVEEGVITHVEISFPPGCHRLAHVQIWYHESQLYPHGRDEDFAADAYTIKFTDQFEINEPPYELKIKGWNEDDTYDHTITVRVNIVPKELVFPAKPLHIIASFLKRVLGI